MRYQYEYVVVGSGVAGLTCAIYLQLAKKKVVVLSKSDNFNDCNSHYAQGGIIAAKADDTPKMLSDDIFLAGANFNNKEAVEFFSNNGPQLVFDFLIDKAGIEFSKNDNGEIDYTEEAAHQVRRILHYKDHTGEIIQEGLLKYAKSIGVDMHSGMTAIDLITNNHHSKDTQELYCEREVLGLYVLDNHSKEVHSYFADGVVLATGGVGNLFQHTTNPVVATGDGMSMAYRAGAHIINAEFIQFHPTSLFHRDIKRFLISESLRGEGARLFDHKGVRFMSTYSDMKELAPRDVVARAIFDRMSQTGAEFLYLDIANFYQGKEPLQERFSKIYHTLLGGGIDITKDPIPVVPAAHYFCGGIKVDSVGQSSIKRLFAVGEVSCTGLHGANRLASTSLLEAILWGKSCAQALTKLPAQNEHLFNSIPDWEFPSHLEEFDPLLIEQDMRAIQLTMWNYAGIIRTKKGLERAAADLNYYSHRIIKFYREATLERSIIELRNAVVGSSIIVDSALQNLKSIGCHYVRK